MFKIGSIIDKYFKTLKKVQKMSAEEFAEENDIKSNFSAKLMRKTIIIYGYAVPLAAPFLLVIGVSYILLHFVEIACWLTALAVVGNMLIESIKPRLPVQAPPVAIAEYEISGLIDELKKTAQGSLVYIKGYIENGVYYLNFSVQGQAQAKSVYEAILNKFIYGHFLNFSFLKTYVRIKQFTGRYELNLMWTFLQPNAEILQKIIDADAALEMQNQADIIE